MIELLNKGIQGLESLRDSFIRSRVRARLKKNGAVNSPPRQDLEMYWDAGHAEEIDVWGKGTAWNEIQFLLANCRGKILDIACGTGQVMKLLEKFDRLEVHGFDISDLHIRIARSAGISPDRLKICDATKTDYPDDSFDYSYSIGSLEHFTEEGILAFVRECHRYTKYNSFHQIPTSRSGRDEGWLRLDQSYFNNSVDWWLEKFKSVYSEVTVLDSVWNDPISIGKWFLCRKS